MIWGGRLTTNGVVVRALDGGAVEGVAIQVLAWKRVWLLDMMEVVSQVAAFRVLGAVDVGSDGEV